LETHGVEEEAERVSAIVRNGDGRSTEDCFAMREVVKNGISGAIQTLLSCQNRVETDFGPDLGNRKAAVSTGMADGIAHELSHRAVATPAEKTAIRSI
jgi:hypothetical protein